jgi:hypothetical protein
MPDEDGPFPGEEPPPYDPVDDLLPPGERMVLKPSDLREVPEDDELPADEAIDPSEMGA